MKIVTINLLLVLFFLSGCGATKPDRVDFKTIKFDKPKTIIINEDYDTVWKAFTTSLFELGFYTESVSKDAGLLTTRFSNDKFPLNIWILNQNSVKLKTSYYGRRSKKTPVGHYTPRDSYLNSSSCVGDKGYAILGNYSRGKHFDHYVGVREHNWGEIPQLTPIGKVQINAHVRRINNKQTTIDFKITPLVPVNCRHHTAVTSSTKSYYINFTDGGAYSKNFKLQNDNAVVKKILSNMKNDCKCENDYLKPGSIALAPGTPIPKKFTRSLKPKKLKVSAEKDIEAQLSKLKRLYKKGLINKKEYQSKKQSLLDSL